MPEQWACGYCGLIVELPPERDRPDLYGAAIMFIREHRFGHITDRLMAAKTDEAIMALADEDVEPGPEVSPGWAHPVTNDDTGPAVEMADAIVRGRA